MQDAGKHVLLLCHSSHTYVHGAWQTEWGEDDAGTRCLLAVAFLPFEFTCPR